MKTVKIRLGGVDEIRAFVNAASMYEYDIDLRGGRYVVDGKSIMGIFSLDLSAPIEMVVYGDKEDELIAKVEKFLV
ncbi:MAG: HPr family phosphocarrier protein [Lachnospiraceae bacterium]|nr:HPr family phosphocarrier protein [Lachnospiraceae bacterium]